MGAEPLRTSSDLDALCRHSDASAPGDETPVGTYDQDRRKLLQTTWEVVVPALEGSVLGYDRVTGILTVGGFKDHQLFDGRYHLRMREGCALHFELDGDRADDVVTRAQLGGVSLKFGFHLDPHDDHDRPICGEDRSATVDGGDEEGFVPTLVHIDLLYAQLIESDGGVLANFQTERSHNLHMRRVSQAIGAASQVVPRMLVTSVSQQDGEGDGSWHALETAEQEWWVREMESALFPCYIHGLRGNGRLQGAMVVRIPSAKSSNHSAPTLLLDTMQVNGLTQCVVERLEGLRERGPEFGRTTVLKATFLFKLE